MATEVHDNPEQHRYEIHIDGVLAGFASYRPHPDERVFLHTEVKPEYGGRGIGSALAKAALDDLRARNLGAVPLCPFITAYIERHSEYADLVVDHSKHS
ncbi:MAG TPA: GNAT family N-acetyltransferase [Micromonosporaceae bacterium]|nr:GNAT family N-acetyltransferase [Micromonosporaceae bacterium]